MLPIVWLAIAAPLAGVLVNGLFGKKMTRTAVGWVACTSVFVSFLVSFLAWLDYSLLHLTQLGVHAEYDPVYFTWLKAGDVSVNFGLLIDPLSLTMMLTVTGVSFLIHVYSTGYMAKDDGYSRYFTYLNLFVAMMLILVMADSLALTFVGWEGVGLCSYLLIGFWYERDSATAAGMKAFIVNRIGDFGFLVGLFLLFSYVHTFDYLKLNGTVPATFLPGDIVITTICLLLFVGAIGKSAQIPLYVWLPDAMEGPTPVSALIHAATMVTAGVFMVVRTNVLFQLAPAALLVVGIVGAATAIYAATIALAQYDIKRVLAYSTISQIGYMFVACGVGAYWVAIFHLVTHAFFKALLFLGSGGVIHATDEQDMRRLGRIAKALPVTYWTFMVGVLAISGAPLFSGFFSKDEILYRTAASGQFALWLVGIVAAGLTAFYMFRLFFRTFLYSDRLSPDARRRVHESPPSMAWPLAILAFFAVIGGVFGLPRFITETLHLSNVLRTFLAPVSGEFLGAAERGPSELLLMGVAVIVALTGFALALNFYARETGVTDRIKASLNGFYTLVLNKFYVDEFYDGLIVVPGRMIATFLWSFFDGRIIDGIVHSTASTVEFYGSSVRRLQTGYVRSYLLLFLLGAVLVLGLIVFLKILT
jgi:NADH-quinone oxidoreductase subunit L